MNWQDGPEALQSAFTPNVAYFDPGAIVTLKSIYQKPSSPPKFATARRAPSTQALKNLLASKEEVARINQEWAHFTCQLATNLCEVLHRAATPVRLAEAIPPTASEGVSTQLPTLTRASFESTKASDDLPIDLHPRARVVSRYDLRWPADAASSAAASADGTELHYVRIQQTTSNLRILVNHYRSELSSPAELLLDGGKRLWLDGRPRSSNAGNKLSVDVFLTRSKAGPGPAPDTEERITVEVLTIEIRTPVRDE